MSKSNSFQINPNIRILIMPIFLIIFLLFLTYFTTAFSLSYVKKIKESEVDTNRKIGVLDEKLTILTRIKDSSIDYADLSLLAVPIENPALWVFSSLKSVTLKHGFEIDDVAFELGQGGQLDTLNTVKINLTLSGEKEGLFSLIKEIEDLLPLIKVNVADVQDKNGKGIKISFSTYYSSIPQKIPALSEPIKNLTETEESILKSLSQKTKPEFSKVEPDLTNDREDPFK